jgi:hypothetical protein
MLLPVLQASPDPHEPQLMVPPQPLDWVPHSAPPEQDVAGAHAPGFTKLTLSNTAVASVPLACEHDNKPT